MTLSSTPISSSPGAYLYRMTRASAGRPTRGAQPRNSNALRHGRYSRYHPHPASEAVRSARTAIRLTSQALPTLRTVAAGAVDDVAGTAANLWSLKQQNWQLMCRVAIRTRQLRSLEQQCLWMEPLLSLARINCRICRTVYELEGRQADIRSIVPDLQLLLGYEFKRRDISRPMAFVPLDLGNFHANSPRLAAIGASLRFLTDDQWAFIQDCFHANGLSLYDRKSSRGRRTAWDPRILLQGILLKLAFGLKWREVPAALSACSPDPSSTTTWPVRIGQEFYRKLYNSGRLWLIYDLLERHLLFYGRSNLHELVDSSTFRFRRDRILPASFKELTWETFTALLLLQRAWRNFRSAERRVKLARAGAAACRGEANPRPSPAARSFLPKCESTELARLPL